MLQLIKEAGCHNGLTPRDDSPVTEVLNQVCPSTWRGACKTAVQLLFGQAGLVSDYEQAWQIKGYSNVLERNQVFQKLGNVFQVSDSVFLHFKCCS